MSKKKNNRKKTADNIFRAKQKIQREKTHHQSVSYEEIKVMSIEKKEKKNQIQFLCKFTKCLTFICHQIEKYVRYFKCGGAFLAWLLFRFCDGAADAYLLCRRVHSFAFSNECINVRQYIFCTFIYSFFLHFFFFVHEKGRKT